MRPALQLLCITLLAAAAPGAGAAPVRSAAPDAVAVTVYRAPDRRGRLELDDLQGFALITETRRVTLPAGESTLRFEGVAGGIQAESALVTGLPEGVVEKNRDATRLSPSALLSATLHHGVALERTNPKTGQRTRTRGTLESDAGGVLFRSEAGVEALRCSGLPETFGFEPFAGANAVPTLSVRVRSEAPVTRTVTLSYLASGFDWSATYTATLSKDGRTLDLGAWVTLANGNGETFREAQMQVVAGRLHREASAGAPADSGGAIIAQCWPRGSTSDGVPPPPAKLQEAADARQGSGLAMLAAAPMRMRSLSAVAMPKVVQEQLGDLKLYRVPERTTVAARQMKQVRLMDQPGVPVRLLYTVSVVHNETSDVSIVEQQLRTRNDPIHHLGLPLPAGSIAVYGGGEASLLLREDELRDHAVDEELVIPLGRSTDIHVAAMIEQRAVDPAGATLVPLLPGVALRSVGVQTTRRVEITNARASEADVEVGLLLARTGEAVVRADRPMQRRNGRPTFTVRVPAHGSATLRYATALTADTTVRPR